MAIYDRDQPKDKWIRLAHLVEQLAGLPGDFRIRLSSIEATEVKGLFVAPSSLDLAGAELVRAERGGVRFQTGLSPAGWTVPLAADTETQEVVVASATCLTGFDLKQYLPVVVVGKGGGAAQSYVDSTGQRRTIIWNGLHNGSTAQQIVDELILVTNSHLHQHGVAEATVALSGRVVRPGACVSEPSVAPKAAGVHRNASMNRSMVHGAISRPPLINFIGSPLWVHNRIRINCA